MNNKRQTIWLVSMLSLMVVLSAYYLFSQDVGNLNVTNPQGTNKLNAVKVDSSTLNNAEKTSAQVSNSDAAVIQKMQDQQNATSGSNYFAAEGINRSNELSKKTDELMAIITNSKANTAAANKAYDELSQLQDNQAKATNIEEKLTKDYPNAIVEQASGKWNVTVESKKLDASQAVQIVDMVMNEMNVGADQVSVKFVQ